jgi:hypothetical protein
MADNTDLLNEIRKVVREEVEAEAKTTRQEVSMRAMRLESRMGHVEDRLKNVEIVSTRLEKGQERLEKAQQEQGKDIKIIVTDTGHTNAAIEILERKIDTTQKSLEKKIDEKQKPKKVD